MWFCGPGKNAAHRGRACMVGYERPPPLAARRAADCKSEVANPWAARHTTQQLEGVFKEVQ